MSHNVDQMAYAHVEGSDKEQYQHPWHIQFTQNSSFAMDPSDDPDEWLFKAGLDYELERYSQFIEVEGKKISTGRDVLWHPRYEEVVTHVSEEWNYLPNSEFVQFLKEYLEEGSMELSTMGSLDRGRITFALAYVKGLDFALCKGKDEIRPYFLISNPHEYGKSINFGFTATRVVCENTMIAALRGMSKDTETSFRMSHRRKFDPTLVKEQLGMARTHMEGYKEAAEFLAKKKVKAQDLIDYYKNVFPSQAKKLDKEGNEKMSRPARIAMDVIDTQPGADIAPGTWWNAFNSVTYTVDHLLGRSEDTRVKSALYGYGRQKKAQALDLALEMAA